MVIGKVLMEIMVVVSSREISMSIMMVYLIICLVVRLVGVFWWV